VEVWALSSLFGELFMMLTEFYGPAMITDLGSYSVPECKVGIGGTDRVIQCMCYVMHDAYISCLAS